MTTDLCPLLLARDHDEATCPACGPQAGPRPDHDLTYEEYTERNLSAEIRIRQLDEALSKTHAWYREALEEVRKYQRRAEAAESKLARIQATLEAQS